MNESEIQRFLNKKVDLLRKEVRRQITRVKKNPALHILENCELLNNSQNIFIGIDNGRILKFLNKIAEEPFVGFDNDIKQKNKQMVKFDEEQELFIGKYALWLKEHFDKDKRQIGMLYINTSEYSVCKNVLELCMPYLKKGSYIFFTKLVNIEHYDDLNLNALCEWCLQNRIDFKWMPMNATEVLEYDFKDRGFDQIGGVLLL